VPKKTRSIQEIQKELEAKQKQVASLRAKRNKLSSQLATVEKQISRLTGGAPAKRAAKPRRGKKARRRRARGKPLVAYIEEVLAGHPKGMRAKDVAAAVAKAGYKSRSKDFYNIVAATLRDKRFKRLSRGVYALAK
jgi:septal ring factor EnvC (AmiA/AmiB activator)